MDDLISRSAAIEALTDALCMTGYQSRGIDAVRFLPTIDAEPVRHAYWHELLGCGYTVCSACDYIPYSIEDKYCPRCGAKMDLPRPTEKEKEAP